MESLAPVSATTRRAAGFGEAAVADEVLGGPLRAILLLLPAPVDYVTGLLFLTNSKTWAAAGRSKFFVLSQPPARTMDQQPTAPAGPPRIRLLPPELANRIAAGEVVERPASVVKELCENALDAGARLLEIDLEGGGATLVRVRDDGHGIAAEEVPLALERHATSKIREARDLEAISTLGFRGEALPAIASVSRFVLQSRARGMEIGARIEVEGGQEISRRAAGCPTGTLVEVRDLFFNTPARRKFLKAEATETGHALEVVSRLALASPDVDFRVRVGDREALTAPPARTLEARAAQVLTREVARHLYPCEGSEGPIRVWGLVGDPGHSRGRPDSIHTFVNGRWVRDRVLQHAVGAAYLSVLDRGRYPWAVLFVELPPGLVDVNVHPAKFEVRFAQGQAVHRAVEHVVIQTLQRAPWAGAARPYVLVSSGNEHAPAPPLGAGPASPAFSGARGLLREGPAPFPVSPPPPQTVPAREREVPPPEGQAGLPLSPPTSAGYFASLRVVGQAHRLYIVCEGRDELVLVDQHAAHERIQFERLREAFQEGRVPSQPLLFPVTLELGPLEREAVEAYAGELARLGFEVEPFGSGTVALKAAPTMLSGDEAPRTAVELLAELARVGRASALTERIEALLATVACHAAVRAGDALSVPECEALLRDLDRVDYRGNCPHGRPVVLRARVAELERGFHRR
jgi:DNA mismatch repair protein MutL